MADQNKILNTCRKSFKYHASLTISWIALDQFINKIKIINFMIYRKNYKNSINENVIPWKISKNKRVWCVGEIGTWN